jgi:predicted RND superfamily exporter protein
LAGIGIGKIRTDIRVTEFLDRSSPTRVALQEFDEVYGGINVVQFKIDSGVENGINDLGFLSYVDQIQRFAAEKAKVSGTYSYTQLMAMMNQIWEGEKEGSLRLPNNPMMVGMFALALKVRKFPFIDALADEEFRTANVIVRTRGMLSSEYLELLREIVAFAEENRPEGVTVSAQQGIHSILEADRRVLDAQINSFTLTFAIIGLTLLFLWRSFWLAALALLVNVIPVGLAISLAGYGDLPLNSVTVMVAAIVLGIAVDDSVHFITWWRDEYRKSGDAKQALASTFRVKGPPILYTSLILTAVFGAFLVFSFPPVRHFGLLSAVAFVGAIFSTLALLPALLRPRPVSAPLSPAND